MKNEVASSKTLINANFGDDDVINEESKDESGMSQLMKGAN